MLKKVVGLLMGILLLMVSVSFAEETPASIQSMTELGEIQKKLDQGITIGKVYYTDGYGFSTSEFTTDDPDEIAQLWNAVNAIRVGEKVNESITDWYPQIVFCLTDGTRGGVRFEAKWLCIGGMENYEISNAEGFWSLTASLVEKHEAMAEGAVRVGWNDDSDLIIVPKEVAWDGLPDGDYVFSTYEVHKEGIWAQVKTTGRIAGSVVGMDDVTRNVHQFTGCSLNEIVRMASVNPARIAGCSRQKGRLRKGYDADMILLDENMNVMSTYVSGKCLFQKKS